MRIVGRSILRKLITAGLSLVLIGTYTEAGRADPFTIVLLCQCLRTATAPARINSYSRGPIILQTSEVTCGPAALATLLHFYFGEDCTEAEVTELAGTFKKGTTTLLALHDVCVAKGYEAIGYKMTLPQLLQEVHSSNVPVLVHFKEPTLHYALVTGDVGDLMLVSDPAWGEVTMHKDDFSRRWSNKALVVRSSRPANTETLKHRQDSAEIRLESLGKASRMMSFFQ